MTKKKKNKGSNDKFKWKITTNRFVGIIDIMGFKDLVVRNDHEYVYEMMKRISEAMATNQSVFSVDYESDAFDVNIIMMTYSDSIMIYSRDNSDSCLENFIASISALSEDLFKNGIPHKGAVAFGKMTLDSYNSIFFGQPLIDAYLLQDEFQLYGIVAHSSVEFENDFRLDETVMEYNCPFKNGFAKHYTILPGTFLSDPFDEKEYQELIQSINKLKINTSGSLRKYIDNTITYLEFSKKEFLKKIEEIEKELDKEEISDDSMPF